MEPAGQLLLREARALPGVLASCRPADFARPTVLPGWSVRDVLVHCGAALGRFVSGDQLLFTPEANQADIDARSHWSIDEVLADLYDQYPRAAEGIDAAGGLADGLALGEWVHGGDVRDALGRHDAFVSAGIDLALPLLVERSRQRGASAVVVSTDREELRFGVDEGQVASLRTDRATFVRLCAGRAPDPSRYHLVGVDEAALAIFS